MNLKPDKECEKRGDIVFLSEIIANSTYWQVNFTRRSHKNGSDSVPNRRSY